MTTTLAEAPITFDLALFAFIRLHKKTITALLNGLQESGQGTWWVDLAEALGRFESYYRGAQDLLRGQAGEPPTRWFRSELANASQRIAMLLLISRSTLRHEEPFTELYAGRFPADAGGLRTLANAFIARNLAELIRALSSKSPAGGRVEGSWKPDGAAAGSGTLALEFKLGRATKKFSQEFQHDLGKDGATLAALFDNLAGMWRDVQSIAEKEIGSASSWPRKQAQDAEDLTRAKGLVAQWLQSMTAEDRATIRAYGARLINPAQGGTLN